MIMNHKSKVVWNIKIKRGVGIETIFLWTNSFTKKKKLIVSIAHPIETEIAKKMSHRFGQHHHLKH